MPAGADFRVSAARDVRLEMWAVVPVKDFTDAKGRLAHALTPGERHDLARAMAEDVLAALMETPELEGVAVVTRDREACALCAQLGVRVIGEEQNEGQTTAVMSAAHALYSEGVVGMLTVPGDVPLVLPSDIRSVLQAHSPAPAMTIVPSRDRKGSNCIVLSPPGCVPLRFGDDSFYPHLEAARRTGIEPSTITLPNLGLDIDSPEDLEVLVSTPSRTRAQAVLFAAQVAERAGDQTDSSETDTQRSQLAVGGAR